MNTTTNAEQTALTLPERAAVALGSSKTEIELRELVKQSADIIEVTNAAGRDQAHRIGMNLKTARVTIEKTGKTAREDAVAFGKAVIAEEKRLVSIVEEEEARVFGLRDSWDAKIEAERQAKINAEIARTAAIADAIAGIRERETDVIRFCKTSADVQIAISTLEAIEISEAVYQERRGDAMIAKDETLAAMRKMLASRIEEERVAAEAKAAAEAEARRLAEERAELARLRAEADERDRLAKAEADRITALQAIEAARLRQVAEEQAAAAKKEQDERDRVTANVKAQLEEKAASLAAERRALEEERAATEKARTDAATPKVDAEEQEVIIQELTSTPPTASWPFSPPTLRLGHIGKRLGFPLSADFLRVLGFEPAGRASAAMLYHEHDFPNICAALIRHITAAMQKQAA